MKDVMDEIKLLNYLISHDIIDMKSIQADMVKEERNKYLDMHKYKIFKDKDNRWKTTLPDETAKSKRKLIARKHLQELEDIIINFYKEKEIRKENLNPEITLNELYPIWMESRSLEIKSMTTIKKNEQDWKRYYLNTDIIKKPLKDLSVNELKDWAHTMIKEHNLDKRAYYNMTVIIKKMFEYAADDGACDNTWSKVKINTKIFRKTVKKENDSEIYFPDEKQKIIALSIQLFKEDPRNITALAIPFLFMTGLRIGELVALKYEDLFENYICIQRSEINDYQLNKEKGKLEYMGKRIVDHVKTDAGSRNVPYPAAAKNLITMIKAASEEYGFYDDNYIFCPRSKRITSNSIDYKIYRYADKLGIPRKSAHKIRKTYISTIITDGIDLDTVCKVSGHVDLKTTFESYLFCLDRKEKTYEKFNNIFNSL